MVEHVPGQDGGLIQRIMGNPEGFKGESVPTRTLD
jgi:hypothetical protein